MKVMVLVVFVAACSGSQGPAGPAGPEGPQGSGVTPGSPPANAAQAVAFVDQDPRQGFITGTLTVTAAGDESDITGYSVYWGSSASAKLVLTPIVELAKTGSNVSFPLPAGTPVPAGATHLLAFASNDSGDSATPAAAAAFDNYPIASDLSLGAAADSYQFVTALGLDTANSKMIFQARQKSSPFYFRILRCNFDGTACTGTDVSNNSFRVVDPVNGKLILQSNLAQGMLVRCELDGTACSTAVNIFTGSGLPASGNTQVSNIVVDSTNQKLLVEIANNAQGIFGVLRANLDLTSPVFVPLFTDTSQGVYNGAGNTLIVDAVASKLLVAATHEDVVSTGAFSAILYSCNLDVTGCTQPLTSAFPSGAPFTSAYGLSIDSATQTFVAATETDDVNGFATAHGLLRCNNTLTTCSALDPAQGASWFTLKTAIDSGHSQIYISGFDPAINATVAKRCGIAGYPCTDLPLQGAGLFDSSAQHYIGSYIDPSTKQPTMYSLRTW